MHIVAFARDNALIGHILANRDSGQALELVWYTVAMSLHFMVNDVALQHDHQDLFARRGRWILAGATLIGWAFGSVIELSELGVSAVTAFIAGAIILNEIGRASCRERVCQYV